MATCNKCGQINLAWVKSERTGRYYLALTQKYHSVQLDNGRVAGGGTTVLKHRPHKCDDERHGGGRPLCDKCGNRHASWETTFCEGQVRATQREAEKDQPLEWIEKTNKFGIRHVLFRADYTISIQVSDDHGIELDTYGVGWSQTEEGFNDLQAAKERGLEIIKERGI